MVIVRDASAFSSFFPNIPFIGELNFGLGNNDAVRLFNSDGNLIDEVDYNVDIDSVSEWPICAYATSYTLELITPALDNSIAESWDCINEFGSPNAPNTSNLSIQSANQLDNIKIYPNPVKDILQITGNSESYNIEIYSLTDQKLHTSSNISKVDMSLYANGIYIVKVYDSYSTLVKRVIKSNWFMLNKLSFYSHRQIC